MCSTQYFTLTQGNLCSTEIQNRDFPLKYAEGFKIKVSLDMKNTSPQKLQVQVLVFHYGNGTEMSSFHITALLTIILFNDI